jgi:hypothetical protein
MKWSRIGAVLLLLGACSTHGAEADECISLWNHGGPRSAVAAEGYALADVSAGENKAGQWGCGFLFHSRPREPWRIYGVIVENGAVVGNWGSTVTGSSWGSDSPEGPTLVTVGVRSDGSLDEP